MEKKNKVLSVRIDPKIYEALAEYAEDHRYSQTKIVEGLLNHFIGLPEAEQRMMVTGRGLNHLALLGKALQLVNWGDHAFRGYHSSRGTLAARGSFLPWVIEIYNKLNSVAASATGEEDLEGILSLRRIAWFKLGAAWIQVAIALRTQALVDLGGLLNPNTKTEASKGKQSEKVEKPSDWNKLYDKAIQSLQIALANYDLFNESVAKFEKHPNVLYNQACAWSLIAQYLGEKEASTEKLEPFATQIFKDEKKKSADQEPEKCLVPEKNSEVEKALRKANNCLNDINLLYTGEAGGVPFADSHWLFDYAGSDPDITCFRLAEHEAFDKWLGKREDRISLLSFRHEIPADVEEILKSKNFN